MSEKQIQNNIIKYLHSKGAYIVKTIVANRSGVPDILCCYKGRFLAIEVKAPSGKLSQLQEHNLKMIDTAQGLGIVARSVDDVIPFIKLLDGEL